MRKLMPFWRFDENRRQENQMNQFLKYKAEESVFYVMLNIL